MNNDIAMEIVAALEFYGDQYNYAPDIEAWMDDPESEIEKDDGKRARDALETVSRVGHDDNIKTIVDLENAMYDVIDRTNVRVTMEAYCVFTRALEHALNTYERNDREHAEIEREYYAVKRKEGII